MSIERISVGDYAILEVLPANTLVMINVDQLMWQEGVVPEPLRRVNWSKVVCTIVICFDNLNDDPRNVWEVSEIVSLARDALNMPTMIRRMPDERDPKHAAVPGCFGVWSFLMTATCTEPIDLTLYSDDPPCSYGVVHLGADGAILVTAAPN